MRSTRSEVERRVKVTTLRVPMALTLEFDRSVSLAEARQLARRVLDQTKIENLAPIEHEALAEVKLTCASLRRVIRWSPDQKVGDA